MYKNLRQCIVFLGLVVRSRCEMEGFIVGGSYADIRKHPHAAYLSIFCVTDSGADSWICGASIINQNILLTAAHCLNGCAPASHISVTVGSEIKDKGQIHTAYGYVIHENYSRKSSSNDIALLGVEVALHLSGNIRRVALMKKPPYKEKAAVAGWGVVDEKRELQISRLKYVSQNVWPRADCLRLFGYLPTGTICASADNKNDYAALGDSGSALTVRGFIQIGVVSYKVPSLTKNIVIYTDVGHFYDWIKQNAQRLFCVSDTI